MLITSSPQKIPAHNKKSMGEMMQTRLVQRRNAGAGRLHLFPNPLDFGFVVLGIHLNVSLLRILKNYDPLKNPWCFDTLVHLFRCLESLSWQSDHCHFESLCKLRSLGNLKNKRYVLLPKRKGFVVWEGLGVWEV